MYNNWPFYIETKFINFPVSNEVKILKIATGRNKKKMTFIYTRSKRYVAGRVTFSERDFNYF